MKEKLKNDRDNMSNPLMNVENASIDPIPISCMNYIKNTSSRSNHYTSINKNDAKRSKSIENCAFRDIGNTNIYMNRQEFHKDTPDQVTKNSAPSYMDFYDHKAPNTNSPLNVLYESSSFKDTKTAPTRQYIPMPHSRGIKENNQPVKAKHESRRSKPKSSKGQRF